MSAEEFRMLYGIPHNRGLVGIRLKKRFVDRQRLKLARDHGHRAKFIGSRRRHPYSVHPPSAAQLGDLRNHIQPLGNRKRWGRSNPAVAQRASGIQLRSNLTILSEHF